MTDNKRANSLVLNLYEAIILKRTTRDVSKFVAYCRWPHGLWAIDNQNRLPSDISLQDYVDMATPS